MMFCLLLSGNLWYSITGFTVLTEGRLPGVLYRGTKNRTETGRTCQRWDTQIPHEHVYDMFSLAQENYCRNFDREEPWCFTNDSNVRWELCGVDVCGTPCLNQSLYDENITHQCVSDTPKSNLYCNYILSLILCFTKNVENATGSQCHSDIEWRSIAFQIQNTIEDLIGKSISECLISPCRDPNLIDNSLGMINVGVPCFYEIIGRFKAVSCQIIQRASHCVISRLNDKTNHTCVVKDKVYLAKKFLPIMPEQYRPNTSLCIKELSEFPAPVENTTDTIALSRDKEANTISQTQVFLATGFTFVMLFVISVTISILRIRKTLMRKKRKELMPLPMIQKVEDPPYEINLTYPDGLYHDPDYEIVDDQDEGYERLPAQIEEIRNQILVDNDSDGVYTDPNNADGTYLDVVHPKIYPHDYINVNPYVDLVGETFECQNVLEPQ